MYATDFVYDGVYLKDFGFIICPFDGRNDMDDIEAGSKITFNTVKRNYGKSYSLAGTTYDECITTEFTIAKDECVFDDMRITDDEFRDIFRWLNRREFHMVHFIGKLEEWEKARYFNASFNVTKMTVNDELYGIKVSMETDKPYGYGNQVRKSFEISRDMSGDLNSYMFEDHSDEIGFIYPNMRIECKNNGTLTLSNNMFNDDDFVVENCSIGEIITVHGDSMQISSVLNGEETSHIANDFNYNFFKIGNRFMHRKNVITASMPCIVEFDYYPVIKDTP